MITRCIIISHMTESSAMQAYEQPAEKNKLGSLLSLKLCTQNWLFFLSLYLTAQSNCSILWVQRFRSLIDNNLSVYHWQWLRDRATISVCNLGNQASHLNQICCFKFVPPPVFGLHWQEYSALSMRLHTDMMYCHSVQSPALHTAWMQTMTECCMCRLPCSSFIFPQVALCWVCTACPWSAIAETHSCTHGASDPCSVFIVTLSRSLRLHIILFYVSL